METFWKSEYNIGCVKIDDAHKKLFGILQKVIELTKQKDYEKNRYACVEALKFLCNYTETHFAEEEAYMREINYEGYASHKKIHENIEKIIIPKYKQALVESDFSRETVTSFVDFFKLWLTNHILGEDRKITLR